ncbi:MAG: anaerobic ribonucleoside-triphosphate reductase, partial [Clostridia bacterium]|nr:anaerobic ribonucleoside-triphosphate reductase [Clostridia bacterium]
KEELTAGVQTIQYQINTLMTTSGKPPFVTLFLNLEDEDEHLEENASIIQEILKQRIESIKDKSGKNTSLEFPKLIYVLSDNNLKPESKYHYITKLAIECSLKHGYPHYISSKKMKERYKENVFSPIGTREILPLWKDEKNKYTFVGRFSQGTVSLNLPQIAIESEKDEEQFWNLLDERLSLCFEALMCRHHSLLGTNSDISPVHWQYGAIARLEPGEKIDKYLKDGYSTLCLGYIGICETTKYMKGVDHIQPEGKEFAMRLMKKLKDTCDKWQQDTKLAFQLYGTSDRIIAAEFVKKDREAYGKIKHITDKEEYTDSYHICEDCSLPTKEKLAIESEFEKFSSGGGISIIGLDENELENILETVKYAYDNIQYFELKKCEK